MWALLGLIENNPKDKNTAAKKSVREINRKNKEGENKSKRYRVNSEATIFVDDFIMLGDTDIYLSSPSKELIPEPYSLNHKWGIKQSGMT